MALTNATTLADYGAGIGTQGATLKVDATNKRVGVGTDSPAGPEGSLQVGTGITFFGNTGIVSAIGGKFSGDFTVGGTLTYEDVANIDAVGIITAQSGVSIADSIFHTGDTNTAIRFPAADTFTVETAGSERLRVNSGGFVGVNTDSPGRQLTVSGGAAEGVIQITNNTSGGSQANGFELLHFTSGETQLLNRENADMRFDTNNAERLRITSGGNVHINGTPPWSVTGGNYRNLSISGNDASSSGFLWLGNGAAATNADFDLGRVNFVNGANIVAQIKGTTQTGANDDGRISFLTKATGSSISERLRINSAGIVTSYATHPQISLEDPDGRIVSLRSPSTSNLAALGTDSNHALLFYTNGYSNERLRIRSEGAHLLLGTGGDISYNEITEGSTNVGLVIGSSSMSNGGIVIRTGTSGTGRIYFADNSGSDAGRNVGNIRYQHSDNTLRMSSGGSEAVVIDAGGNFNITGITTGSQFDATSDVALKENIEVIDEPITKLSELKGVTFDWKKGGHSVGVIAQDVEKVLPTAVGGNKDKKTVNYNAIIGLLVESVKDQQKQIEELKSLLDK